MLGMALARADVLLPGGRGNPDWFGKPWEGAQGFGLELELTLLHCPSVVVMYIGLNALVEGCDLKGRYGGVFNKSGVFCALVKASGL